MYVNAVVNFFFQLNFSFPLFLCMLVYGNVRKNNGKLKFNCNIMMNKLLVLSWLHALI